MTPRPAEHGAALLGQPLEPAGQHVGDRGRRVGLAHQPGQVAAVVGEAGVLDEEERVAVGARGQQPGLLLVRHHLGDRLHDRGRLGGGETGQLEPRGVPAGQRLGGVGQRTGGLGVGAPGAEHEQPARLHGLRQQPQHPQGGHVGPVQVVEDDHDRLVARRSRGDGRDDRLPRAELGTLVLRVPHVEIGAEPAEHLLPGPERRCAVVLRAPTHQQPARRGARRGPPARRTAGTCRCPARR